MTLRATDGLSHLIVGTLCVASAWFCAAAEFPQRAIAELKTREAIPVVAYSVWQDGMPKVARVLGAEPSTPIRWGSITKTITALTVLQMAEHELLSLDQTAVELIGSREWGNPWPSTDPVTVLQLLELSAGFPDLSGVEFNYPRTVTLDEALAISPAHRHLRWPAGLQHIYSNLTPGLSQLVIERASGMGFADAVTKFVFNPLQMHDSGFVPRDDLPGGFKADGRTPIPYWHMTFPAFGALNAPLRDMEQLLDAAMNGKGLNPRVLNHLLTPHTSLAARAGFTFDYASGLYPRVRRGHVWYNHGGDADGYRSRLAFLADHKRGYITAINTDNPRALRELEAIFETWLTHDLAVPDPVVEPRIDTDELARWAGFYYPSGARFGLSRWREGRLGAARIEVRDNSLLFVRNGNSQRLLPVTSTFFRRERDPVATLAFVTDRDEHVYLQGELGAFVRVDGPRGCPSFMKTICAKVRHRSD
jgi:CubicO group peptidase (beta-lactamase class C family)